VIGGGFAGLSAATALAERGVRVTVLEARPALGGRAAAFTDAATGERVDNGQHVLIGGYRETFRFLGRLGTAGDVHLQRHLTVDVVDRAGRRSRLACPPLPAPFHLLAGVMRWTALDWRDRIAVLRMRAVRNVQLQPDDRNVRLQPEDRSVRPRTDPRDSRLQPDPRSVRLQPDSRSRELGCRLRSETVRAWLQRMGQTPRLIELLWEPLAVAALNESIDVAAAEPFAAVLGRMFSSDRRDSALGLPTKPLDTLYAAPARAFIERRGGTVRTGAPARIHSSPRLRVRVRDEELQARVVICAAPWYALGEIFVDRPSPIEDVLIAAEGTPASPIVTVNLWFDRPVIDTIFVGLPGRAMQWLFDKRTLFGEASSHLSLVSSGAGSVVGQTNRQIIDLAVDELTSALPGARGAVLRRAGVIREKRATFSVAPGLPPRPSTRTPLAGLILAGDWIDTGLPATIESAVMSGHAAALAALGELESPT
jgi:hydroxysqualene dehydroxylase